MKGFGTVFQDTVLFGYRGVIGSSSYDCQCHMVLARNVSNMAAIFQSTTMHTLQLKDCISNKDML